MKQDTTYRVRPRSRTLKAGITQFHCDCEFRRRCFDVPEQPKSELRFSIRVDQRSRSERSCRPFASNGTRETSPVWVPDYGSDHAGLHDMWSADNSEFRTRLRHNGEARGGGAASGGVTTSGTSPIRITKRTGVELSGKRLGSLGGCQRRTRLTEVSGRSSRKRVGNLATKLLLTLFQDFSVTCPFGSGGLAASEFPFAGNADSTDSHFHCPQP